VQVGKFNYLVAVLVVFIWIGYKRKSAFGTDPVSLFSEISVHSYNIFTNFA
jgi:hypothetical protein